MKFRRGLIVLTYRIGRSAKRKTGVRPNISLIHVVRLSLRDITERYV